MTKLNCVPGDLCRIIVPGPFRDKLVIVTELSPLVGADGTVSWVYQPPSLFLPTGHRVLAIYDHVLRPIRNTDGQDETLTWVEKETA